MIAHLLYKCKKIPIKFENKDKNHLFVHKLWTLFRIFSDFLSFCRIYFPFRVCYTKNAEKCNPLQQEVFYEK